MEGTGAGGLGGLVWGRSCRREMRQVEAAGRKGRWEEKRSQEAGGVSPSEAVLCQGRCWRGSDRTPGCRAGGKQGGAHPPHPIAWLTAVSAPP